jgi:hypothetical protein
MLHNTIVTRLVRALIKYILELPKILKNNMLVIAKNLYEILKFTIASSFSIMLDCILLFYF